MRRRDITKSTGLLLTWYSREQRSRNSSLFFLVAKQEDIAVLAGIERALRESLGRWSPDIDPEYKLADVADHSQLVEIDPDIDARNVFPVEVCEFAGLAADKIAQTLDPTLELARRGSSELFPTAGAAVGAPARGVNLLGREEVVTDLIRILDRKESLLLVAPRRSGKTSILHRVHETLKGAGRAAIMLDLQGDPSLDHTAARLWSQATGVAFGQARQRARSAEGGWTTVAREALARLQASGKGTLVVLLDELVYLLTNQRDGNPLRSLADLAAVLQDAKVQVVVAGSIDLERYLREKVDPNLSTLPAPFDRFTRHVLSPLAPDQHQVHLRRVLIGTGLVPTREEFAWLDGHVDLGFPLSALLFLDRVRSLVQRESITAVDLDRELQLFLRETLIFDDFWRRLDEPDDRGGDIPWRRKALTELARRRDGMSEPDLLALGSPSHPITAADVSWLIESFPLRLDDGQVRMASCLFRKWWELQQAGEPA